MGWEVERTLERQSIFQKRDQGKPKETASPLIGKIKFVYLFIYFPCCQQNEDTYEEVGVS